MVYMPDPKDLVGKAYHSLRNTSDMEVNPVNIPVNGNELDTVLAAEKMSKMGVAAIITIGGDGTNRLVVKQAIDVPLIPISTGTNNIFPDFIEGTRAGFAAGISLFSIAGEIDKKKLCIQNKLIRAECDGWYENALIDLAISNSEHIGGRALWNPDSLSHIFVTQASAGAIGLSGIVGAIMEIGQNDPHCAYLKMGRTKFVKAILAPGFVGKVGIHSVEKIDLNFKKTIYKLKNIEAPEKWHRPELELEVDTEEDVYVMSKIFEHFHTVNNENFGIDDIIEFMDSNPDLKKINAEVPRRWKAIRGEENA